MSTMIMKGVCWVIFGMCQHHAVIHAAVLYLRISSYATAGQPAWREQANRHIPGARRPGCLHCSRVSRLNAGDWRSRAAIPLGLANFITVSSLLQLHVWLALWCCLVPSSVLCMQQILCVLEDMIQ